MKSAIEWRPHAVLRINLREVEFLRGYLQNYVGCGTETEEHARLRSNMFEGLSGARDNLERALQDM